MADEPSNAELARRMDRIEQLLQDLSLRLVSADVYTRDQREIERRFAELQQDLEAERAARKEAIKAVYERLREGGANWRQALYGGLIPGVLVLLGVAVNVLLALRSK